MDKRNEEIIYASEGLTVFKVIENSGVTVCKKQYSRTWAEGDSLRLDQIKAEGEALALVKGGKEQGRAPSRLIHALSRWMDSEHINYITAYYPLGTLAMHIERQRVSPSPEQNVLAGEPQILRFIWKIYTALAFLWKKNILHRDVRPQHIFLKRLTPTASYVLGGLGRCTSAKSLPPGKSLQNLGEEGYKAPEIGVGVYDYRVDIYSLGACVLALSDPLQLGVPKEYLPGATKLKDVSADKMSKPMASLIMLLMRPSPADRIGRIDLHPLFKAVRPETTEQLVDEFSHLLIDIEVFLNHASTTKAISLALVKALFIAKLLKFANPQGSVYEELCRQTGLLSTALLATPQFMQHVGSLVRDLSLPSVRYSQLHKLLDSELKRDGIGVLVRNLRKKTYSFCQLCPGELIVEDFDFPVEIEGFT